MDVSYRLDKLPLIGLFSFLLSKLFSFASDLFFLLFIDRFGKFYCLYLSTI